MMKQFWEIKSAHPDKLLFFRMGDFYELFHDDAVTVAPLVGIALTSRNKGSADSTPMCGVPHHSIANPINILLKAGHRVAICDQLEDPKDAKGIVKRGVTRILTPGMVFDPETLKFDQPNYIGAFDFESLSLVDSTTGEAFYYKTSNPFQRDKLLRALRPVEMVFETEAERESFSESNKELSSLLSVLNTNAGLSENIKDLFGDSPASAQLICKYIVSLQGDQALFNIRPFEERETVTRLELSSTVLKHLEIFESYQGERAGSLLNAINRTKSPAGARKLRNWIQFPLCDRALISLRQNQIEIWRDQMPLLKRARECLSQMGDIERRLSKVTSPNCHPRDILSLTHSLESVLNLASLIQSFAGLGVVLDGTSVEKVTALTDRIRRTLVDDPPLQLSDGKYIKRGLSVELDELIELAENGQQRLLELEVKEREQTGITSLKIRYNRVFGYYIEITNTHKEKVPSHYMRKQTLVNAERYLTDELQDLERRLLSARDKRANLESEIFSQIRLQVLKEGSSILKLSSFSSDIDVITGLSWLAIENKYVRPVFSNDGSMKLKDSRHPVVEQESHSDFVANSLFLPKGGALLITGPNMAGKSTLMRQVALISIMAQMGSFVPATQAELPILDRIFTRIGANDSLSQGLSTFMVEMSETAEMLSNATENSLVILDEVGRGTSTYDGMSLAQAILEHLQLNVKSLTLFATHYHELTAMESNFQNLKNVHMAIHEASGKILFQYTMKSGPADKSYGVEVAKLAGLPKSVVGRAAELLKQKESERLGRASTGAFGRVNDQSSKQLDLFEINESQQKLKLLEELTQKIKDFSVENHTPLQTAQVVQEWQKNLQ